MSWSNVYHRRTTEKKDAQSCWIQSCRKPTTTVIITVDKPPSDWFYICPGHLKDRGFAIAKDEGDIAEKKRKEEMDKEVELVKKEFEEKMRKKLARRKQKEHEPEDKKEKKKEEAKEDEKDEKERDDKLEDIEKKTEAEKLESEGPRIFELNRSYLQMRVQWKRGVETKKRDAEMSKKNRDRLRTAGAFPSVPTGGV